MSADILIVEDEAKLASLIADFLHADGFTTRWVANGMDVPPAIDERMPDLVLLDLMLPGRDGRDICRDLRAASQVPIIMLTAQVEEGDRLDGLDLGADDYICKPFSLREMVARVKAVLRRTHGAEEPSTTAWRLDPHTLEVACGNERLMLTSVEYRLMEALASSPGRIFTRETLMDRLYDDHRIVSDRTIDSHVKKLRRKLDSFAVQGESIESVYGVGYRMVRGESATKDGLDPS